MKLRQFRISARALLIIIVLVMLGLNILIAQVLERIIIQRRSGAADTVWTPDLIEQCKKLGVNSAINMNGISLGQVNISIETGMHWYEGYLSTDDFGKQNEINNIISQINKLHEADVFLPTLTPTPTATSTTSPTASPSPTPTPAGVHVVLRAIGPGPTTIGDTTGAGVSSAQVAAQVNAVANGVADKTKKIYFMAGHNEPNCSEYVPPAEEVAFVNSLLSKITAPNVEFISPNIDVHCSYPQTNDPNHPLYKKLKEYGIPESKWPAPGFSLSQYLDGIAPILNNDKIKYVAISAYNTEHTAAVDVFNQFKALGKTNKPIIINETGMFDQNVSRLSQTLKTFQEDEQVAGILIFNAFGYNDHFPYHQKLRCDLHQFHDGLSQCFVKVDNPKRFSCTVQPIPTGTPSATPTGSATPSPSPTGTPSPTPTPPEVRLPDTPGTFTCSEVTLQGALNYNQNVKTLITRTTPNVTIPPQGGTITTAVVLAAQDGDQALPNQGIIISVLGTNFAAHSSDEGGNPSQVVINNIKENFTYNVFINLLDKDSQRCKLEGSFVYRSAQGPTGTPSGTPSGSPTPTPIANPGTDPNAPPVDGIVTAHSYSQLPYINKITVVEGIPVTLSVTPVLATLPVSNLKITSKPTWLTEANGVLSGTPPAVDQNKVETVEFTYTQGGKLYKGTIEITIIDNPNRYLPVLIKYQLQSVRTGRLNHPLVSLNWMQSGTSVLNLYAAGNNQGEIWTYFDSAKGADTLQVNPLVYLQRPFVITDLNSLITSVNGKNTITITLPKVFLYGDFDKTSASLDKITVSDYSLFLKYYRQEGPVANGNRDERLWAEDRSFLSINFGKTSND